MWCKWGAGMPSSVIQWFQYSPDKQELLIGFQSGLRYAYQEVPEAIYLGLKEAPSKGAFFNDHIRENYRFERRGSGESR